MNKEKNVDWEMEYKKLAKTFADFQDNDKTNEILRRLDVIGDMFADYIRTQDLNEIKKKMERAKEEYDCWHDTYEAKRNRYYNEYRERL